MWFFPNRSVWQCIYLQRPCPALWLYFLSILLLVCDDLIMRLNNQLSILLTAPLNGAFTNIKWQILHRMPLNTMMGRHNRLTLALASRLASASAAMALWSWRGSLTSLISTRSTLMPQSSVASSREDWEEREREKCSTLFKYFTFAFCQDTVVNKNLFLMSCLVK